MLERIAAWVDLRPAEGRQVTLSFLGAFLVMAFLILARSLREALYLTTFDVETLPYITAAVALLSVPAVGLFVRSQTRHSPTRVLRAVAAVLGIGLLALIPAARQLDVAVVLFYVWTALGSLLLASGFWIVTAEYFPVRKAKRLFGLIGAGGTAGAMVMGSGLVWLTRRIDLAWLILLLVVLLGLLYLIQRRLPPLSEAPAMAGEDGQAGTVRDSLASVWNSPHLRTAAIIVFAIAVATTLLDYQFKELARAHINTGEGLTSFFGAFYGWTGGFSLLIQLFVVARFLAAAGLAWTLAALPLALLLGSLGLLIAPGLVLVTAVRGADATLRKSVYRSALEVLYVPVPSALRRKTKTFIDSVVDSGAEGVGAGIVFLWVTLGGLPSRYLSIYVLVLSATLLYLSRRMGQQYFNTVLEGLKDRGDPAAVLPTGARLDRRDLLSGSFTRIDIPSLAPDAEPPSRSQDAPPPGPIERSKTPVRPAGVVERLGSPDLRTVAHALEEARDWKEEHVPHLCRLLARDALLDRAVAALLRAGDIAVPHLLNLLNDESVDFVIRRRIPRVLARTGGADAEDALLDALLANRFEVRYRSGIALTHRRRRNLPGSDRDDAGRIWQAIRAEVSRERPVWELQKLLDEPAGDDLVARRVGVRGELSLEHMFRLLALVLEPEAVRAAFHGVILGDDRLRSFALEYLEQVLPADIRDRLWPFIGDVSEYQRKKSLRPLDDVVSDLITTGATLFADTGERAALKRILRRDGED